MAISPHRPPPTFEEEVRRELRAMERDGEVTRTPAGKYRLTAKRGHEHCGWCALVQGRTR